MFKSLTHIGLALALILPPWPLTHAPIIKPSSNLSSATIPVLDGQRITPTRPLIFSDTLNGLNVTTTITQTQQQLIQEVQMTGSKESVHFRLILIPNESEESFLRSQTPKYLAKQDEFIFSQKIQDNKILTKELINTKTPNTKSGSIYTWRLLTDDPLVMMDLQSTSDGGADIIRVFDEQRIIVAHIKPFIYWTKTHHQKVAAIQLSKDALQNSVIELLIHEDPSAYPLTIDPSIAYGQWLGDGTTITTRVLAIALEPVTGEIYAGGSASGVMANIGTMVGTFNGETNGFVVEIIGGNPPAINWYHDLDGAGNDTVLALAVNGDEIYAGGYANSSDSWDSAGSNVGTMTNSGNPGEGFIVEIADGASPTLSWHMWLGGVGGDAVRALSINGDEIYAAGSSNSSDSWDTAGLELGTLTNTSNEGFVVEIADGAPPTINWRMWVGGEGSDIIYALTINGDEIYAGGSSTSTGSWETLGSTVGTLTNTSAEGFVVEIADGAPPSINWCMWVGGVGIDMVYSLAVNGDEIYAGGYTDSSASWDTAGSTFGTVTNTLTNGEGFVVEIADGGPPTLNWRMFIGGRSAEIINALSVNGDEIYAGGYSNNSASWDTVGSTVGTHTNSATSEGFVVEITDGSPPSLAWRAWIGNNFTNSAVNGLAINGDVIYAGGYTQVGTFNLMETFTVISGADTQGPGWIAQLDDAGPPTYYWLQAFGGIGSSAVRGVAVNGDEIYAGGEAYLQSPGTFFEVGTANSQFYEAYVVEIADGSTPSIVWRMWLGGSGYDFLRTLIVNGDEIYAGGYANSSDSWDTAGSNVGTMTNSGNPGEGFIVEIADGSPPSLTWRMWLGGVGSDVVYSLAVNGDEIYAGGYTDSSDSWETAGSTVGTLTNTLATGEGFVVEIADGSPPSLTWRMWLGGVGSDAVYGLAVNGDEIYAGGFSNSSDSWDTVGSTVGTLTNTSNEGFVVEIADGAPPSINWLMWVGGLAQDQVRVLSINGDEIYAGGTTTSLSSWDTAGSTVGTYGSTGQEGYILEIADGGPPNLDWLMWIGGDGADYVFTLAVNGDEIYGGGEFNSSDSWDTAGSELGTFTNSGTFSAYIVEIADGAPPSLTWRMWISSAGSDAVLNLTVNGDEVYAGGVISSSSQGLEGVYQGTRYDSSSAAFIVEIADDATAASVNALFFGTGF